VQLQISLEPTEQQKSGHLLLIPDLRFWKVSIKGNPEASQPSYSSQPVTEMHESVHYKYGSRVQHLAIQRGKSPYV